MQAMKKTTAKVKPEADVGEKADKVVAQVKTGMAHDFHMANEAEAEKMDEKETANQLHKPNSDVISYDSGSVMPYPCFTTGNFPGKNLL